MSGSGHDGESGEYGRQMPTKPLLILREVVVTDDEGRELGPLSCVIHRGERLWLEGADAPRIRALEAVLTGRLKPSSGSLEELQVVVTQSDGRLRASIPRSRSINDFLHSPDCPEFIRLEGRRRSIRVLLDRLELTPGSLRRPLKMQPPEIVEKYLALRFITSQADLLVGGDIYSSRDPAIRHALRSRWGDHPGAVLAATSRAGLPGRPDSRLGITPGGELIRLAIGQEEGEQEQEAGGGAAADR